MHKELAWYDLLRERHNSGAEPYSESSPSLQEEGTALDAEALFRRCGLVKLGEQPAEGTEVARVKPLPASVLGAADQRHIRFSVTAEQRFGLGTRVDIPAHMELLLRDGFIWRMLQDLQSLVDKYSGGTWFWAGGGVARMALPRIHSWLFTLGADFDFYALRFRSASEAVRCIDDVLHLWTQHVGVTLVEQLMTEKAVTAWLRTPHRLWKVQFVLRWVTLRVVTVRSRAEKRGRAG